MTTEGFEFSLVFSRSRGAVVVHVHGALNASAAPQLKDRLVDVIDGQGNRQLVLDLGATTFIDSTGVSVLVDALKRMQGKGGELVLSGPRPDVRGVFAAAGVDKIFDITPAWTHPAGGGLRFNGGKPAGWWQSA